MAQLVKKRRPGWVLLVVSALVASLFAVPAIAIDDDSKPNAPAATSACVGDATSDMMFSDVSEGHAFRADINCLAYYGVTIGYGDGNFGPNNDVSNEEMILFMERAAGIAGADAEAVVGDFAMSGSDPVHRGDMALLIARLLASATTAESARNVTISDGDGTFAVSGVEDDDWDYFADSRRSQNRVHDSAASALYELGVAKGTGMGYFSPTSTVSRGAMAAFITRALAHTTARPEGVTIQSDGPGEVIISVRDSNFHPVANAAVDVFSANADRVGEAFNEDGSCYEPRLTGVGGNADVCEIDALDAVTGLSGDYDPGMIEVNVKAGGTTVWAWTGENGDEVEDGAEGLASINLTETAPVTATDAKVTNDIAMGATRVHFGETVTVTIQLVGSEADNRADAVPPTGGASYEVKIFRFSESDIRGDEAPEAVTADRASSVETQVLKVDASGKATFTITASDPDATDRNNPVGGGASGDADDADASGDPAIPDKIDRVMVTYKVKAGAGGLTVNDDLPTTGNLASGAKTITFSDERGVMAGASIEPSADFLTRPQRGSASNVVTVKVVDQYGGPVRGHLVRLTSTHVPTGDGPNASTFPVPRRTDSSGSVRIGYTYEGTGSVETITVNTSSTAVGADADLTAITGSAKDVYWADPAGAGADGTVVAADLDRKTIIVVPPGAAPLLVTYDDNDQYVVGGEETSMAAFEEALTADADDNDDTIEVTSYDRTDAGDVARFVLIVV